MKIQVVQFSSQTPYFARLPLKPDEPSFGVGYGKIFKVSKREWAKIDKAQKSFNKLQDFLSQSQTKESHRLYFKK